MNTAGVQNEDAVAVYQGIETMCAASRTDDGGKKREAEAEGGGGGGMGKRGKKSKLASSKRCEEAGRAYMVILRAKKVRGRGREGRGISKSRKTGKRRKHSHRAVSELLADNELDLTVRLDVDRRSRLVEYKNLALPQEGALRRGKEEAG